MSSLNLEKPGDLTVSLPFSRLCNIYCTMMTFRDFIESDMANTMTSGDDKRSHDDLNVLGRELDIDPESFEKALQGTPILSFSPLDRKGKDRDSGPQVIIPDKVNQKSGSVQGRMMAGNRQKRRNPNGLKSHNSPEFDPINFRPINRKDASYTFSNVWLEPFRASQQSGGSGMMGTPPGMPAPGGGM